MSDFVSELKKIGCDRLIRKLSILSANMFLRGNFTYNAELSITRYGFTEKASVMVTAWDLLDMEYLSVLHSNDFRNMKATILFGQFLNLYREYENNHSVATSLKRGDKDYLFRAIMGMTAEQFQFQSMVRLREKFNRDYYILYAADFEHSSDIDVDAVSRVKFNFSVDDYIALLVMVWGLCAHQPEPLEAFRRISDLDKDSIFCKENVEKLINYYSCSYDDLRNTKLGKQLLYSKPFIYTQRKKYITSSLFLVAMTVANGLYWLVRDYYKDSQKFVNAFGLLFEDYIKNLSFSYCTNDEWTVLPPSKEKGADFYYDFGSLRIIVESKTSLLNLDAKQQVPNMSSADRFFSNTISESYTQLESSYAKLKGEALSPVIKVILLYDEFSNTAIIEKGIDDIFANDPLCFIMTISEFEILLYLHHNDTDKFDIVIRKILDCISGTGSNRNIGAIFQSLSIFDNPHWQGDNNFFSAHLDRVDRLF